MYTRRTVFAYEGDQALRHFHTDTQLIGQKARNQRLPGGYGLTPLHVAFGNDAAVGRTNDRIPGLFFRFRQLGLGHLQGCFADFHGGFGLFQRLCRSRVLSIQRFDPPEIPVRFDDPGPGIHYPCFSRADFRLLLGAAQAYHHCTGGHDITDIEQNFGDPARNFGGQSGLVDGLHHTVQTVLDVDQLLCNLNDFQFRLVAHGKRGRAREIVNRMV